MADLRGYKVVFEGEGWSIIENKPEGVAGLIASHVACEAEDKEGEELKENRGRAGVMSWFTNEEAALCYYCGTSVPAEIQALMHLSCSF